MIIWIFQAANQVENDAGKQCQSAEPETDALLSFQVGRKGQSRDGKS